MALAFSIVRKCSMCLSERCMVSVVSYRAERGYRTGLCRKIRASNLLSSKISEFFSRPKHRLGEKLLFYRSKHKFAKTVLPAVDSYESRSSSGNSELVKKVSVLMDHDGLNGLFDNEGASIECGLNLKDEMDDFDLSLACRQFPAIKLGQFKQVELYDGTKCSPDRSSLSAEEICEELLSSSTNDNLADWDSLVNQFVNKKFLLQNQKSSSPKDTETLEFEAKSEINLRFDNHANVVAIDDKQDDPSVDLILDKPINFVPGLTKKQCTLLESCGFHTFRKLLHYFPRTYADLHNAQTGIEDGQYLIFVGKILSSRAIRASRSLSFLEVIVACEVVESDFASELRVNAVNSGSKRTIYVHLKKFFRGTRFTYQPFLTSIQNQNKEGDIVCVSGKVKTMNKQDHYEMREYILDMIRDENDESTCVEGRPYPIYPSKAGLNPKLSRDIIGSTLRALPVNVDPIPKGIVQEFGLPSLYDAYFGIHQPKNFKEADLARKRLIFDEFFYLQLGRLFQMVEGLGSKIEKEGLLDKYRKPKSNEVIIEEWRSLTKKFLKALPYSLTSGQLGAASEIIWDLNQQVPMNRLLQGDVGCGKTVVAFLACMEVIGSGYQAAFMVPTELLAVQHYEHLLSLLENMEDVNPKPSIALLTGSTPLKNSRLIREGLRNGDIALVIGTHSLIAEKVEFSALRISVVDEQHRFGVIQRGRFNSKLYNKSDSSRLVATDSTGSSKADMDMAPHVLAMSATPIPRTLALALYGDMSLTQITDLPPGRIPVETLTIAGNAAGFDKAYQMMLEEAECGGRVYIVYPTIEKSEQLPHLRGASADFEHISSRFQGISCGLLHGKMKSDEKDEALRRFRSGETQILLSTQVIEIGVDIPDASMMVVMNAERFGIAQLHQLRGRVGRGVRKSKCLLITSTATGLSRLKVMEKSSDGFHLANMDLLLRGPGDLLGRKQSGHLPEFPVARLEVDGNILQDAHLAALKVLEQSHDLDKFPHLKAELSMRQPLCLLGD